MKIKDFVIYTVKPRWIFIKIITDDGFEGWGEMISGTKTETVVAEAKLMCSRIIGRNPFEIEKIWQELYRVFFRGGPINMTVISGIEMALWDIKGKYYNAPIYEFLGGASRDKIKIYSWIGGDRPNDVLNDAKDRIDRGFDSIKMNATEELHYIDNYEKIQKVVERVAILRQNFGYKLNIGIDFHGRVHKSMAKILAKELEIYKPMFLEEVVLPENGEYFKEISKYVTTPLATGERLCARWDFKKIFEEKVIDIIQPDVALTGGILEMKKIISMAEAYDVAAAPHAPYGPIALAATLQVDVSCPNVFIQEQSLGIHYNKGYDIYDFIVNKDVFDYDKGYVKIPKLPGLGLVIDEEKVKKVSKEGLNWTNPNWKNYDGTKAEW